MPPYGKRYLETQFWSIKIGKELYLHQMNYSSIIIKMSITITITKCRLQSQKELKPLLCLSQNLI